MQYPFELNRRQISLPSAPTERRRFSVRAANIMLPKFSIIRSYGSTPWLKTVPFLTPLPLFHALNLFSSYSRRPFSFSAGRSIHTTVKVSHSPLSTLFCSPLNSSIAPNFTSLIDVVLQECRNMCTCLLILSIRYAPKRGSFATALSYCHSKRSI